MEFTVYTTAGGLREFPEGSSYEIGPHNGVLRVIDGASAQVISYGPNAWSSVQEKLR